MFGQFFSAVGSAIGGSFGGGILSTIGRYAGKLLGDYLDDIDYEPPTPPEPKEYFSLKNVKDSFNLSLCSHGTPIPLIFGTVKLEGKIIWSSQIKEKRSTYSEKKYFRDNVTVRAINNITECEYFLSFAIAICEGEIAEIARVWANGELINLGDYNFKLYNGCEEQLPDPIIAASNLQGQTPAHRGLCYIVFDGLPLADFGDCVPCFSFEVTRKANIKLAPSVEDVVRSMIMIPGSGEYVYDTKVQYKLIKDWNGNVMYERAINSHNYRNLANSVYSLNQLILTCENVKWVAPVACWFGDSADAGVCTIRPAIEFNDPAVGYSEEWKVGKYTRSNAKLILRDEEGNPKYGGSVNDSSIIRYLQELRSRGLKIMFYPMFFLDVEFKPWRGRLTGSPQEIRDFFNKDQGYNNFIIHYANLVKDHVDAFVIGSELIGLTSVTDGKCYPAVDELLTLARIVKQIVGDKVLVTYAADWSEYHHTVGGWYNLDPLWASPCIDFIGIDAYFPVTRTTSSLILVEDIVKGWKTGEGYDYYIDGDGNQQPLAAPYAWKNLKYWWENHHYNPGGAQTEWQPRSKKIWFTEFGFPSIDKATNQPNVFFDPNCLDGGVPRYSSGEIDFSIQRKAIKAFIQYWDAQEYIGEAFLWTWDARPYPAWPHMNIWRDGYLWEKGHWVNNKFGAASVAAIILELSARCEINLSKINVNDLDESVEGFILSKCLSAKDAINILRINNFFDVVTTQGDMIRFIRRGFKTPYPVSTGMLLKISENSFIEQIDISKENILSKLKIHFINHADNYKNSYCQMDSENFSNKFTAEIRLPISLSALEAYRLGRLILNNALNEDKIIKFHLPISFIMYEPSDLISLNYNNFTYQVRIIAIKLSELKLEVTGIFDEFESYHLPTIRNQIPLEYKSTVETEFKALDLPFVLSNQRDEKTLVVYLRSESTKGMQVSLNPQSTYSHYTKIANLKPGAVIGKSVGIVQNDKINIFLTDQSSKIKVECRGLNEHISSDWILAKLGDEIIKFKCINSVGEDLFEIQNMIRGVFATEQFIHNHFPGEDFILLEVNPNFIGISQKLLNENIGFKLSNHSNVQEISFANNSSKLLPVFIEQNEICNGFIKLKWRVRMRDADNWLESKDNNYEFEISVIKGENTKLYNTIHKNLDVKIDDSSLSGKIIINIITKIAGSNAVSTIATKTITI